MKKASTTTSPSKFNHAQLQEALLVAQDYLERSMVPFVLLDETAKQMLNEMPTLDLNEISVGVLEQHWTEFCVSTFRSLVPSASISKDVVDFTINKVPIIIWIIHRKFDVFKHPDTRFYYTSEFRLPNPFNKYWKIRHFIK